MKFGNFVPKKMKIYDGGGEIMFENLPFELKTNSIIYMESDYDEVVNRFIQMYYNDICADFKGRGYNFIYFPLLSNEGTYKIVNRLFPNSKEIWKQTISFKNNFILQFLCNDYGGMNNSYYGPSLVYCPFDPLFYDEKGKAIYDCQFFPITDMTDCFLTNDLSFYLDFIEDSTKTINDIEKGLAPYADGYTGFDDWTVWELLDEENEDDESSFEDKEARINKSMSNVKKKKFQNILQSIKNQISQLNDLDKDKGLFRYCLRREMINICKPISNLEVLRGCKIMLTDYNIEITLLPLHKAFYLLYLNHPEGIDYRNIILCKEELVQWYRWCNHNFKDGDENKIYDKLSDKREEEHNPIVEIISKIKGKLKHLLGTYLAEKYCISKNEDGIYRIQRTYNVKIDKSYNIPFKEDLSPKFKPEKLK